MQPIPHVKMLSKDAFSLLMNVVLNTRKTICLGDNNETMTDQPFKRLTVHPDAFIAKLRQAAARGIVCGLATDHTLQHTLHLVGVHLGIPYELLPLYVCKQGTVIGWYDASQHTIFAVNLLPEESEWMKHPFAELTRRVKQFFEKQRLLLVDAVHADFPPRMFSNTYKGVGFRDPTRECSFGIEVRRMNDEGDLVVDPRLTTTIAEFILEQSPVVRIPEGVYEQGEGFVYMPPRFSSTKADGIREILGWFSGRVLFVGNGANDIPVAELAAQESRVLAFSVANGIQELRERCTVLAGTYTHGVVEFLDTAMQS